MKTRTVAGVSTRGRSSQTTTASNGPRSTGQRVLRQADVKYGVRIVCTAEQSAVSGSGIVHHISIAANIQVEDRRGAAEQVEALISIAEIYGDVDREGLTSGERRIK